MRRTDTDPGWINRRFASIERMIREERAAKRLGGSSFPPGSIPPSALTAPATPEIVNLAASSFALSATAAYVVDAVVPVPAGFTSVVASLTGRVLATNPTATTAYLSSRVEVGGATGTALPTRVVAGDSGLNVSPYAVVLVPPESQITVRVSAWVSEGAWAAQPGHTADVVGTLMWFS